MLMSPNKGETAVHGCHYPADMVKCACLRYWPGRGFKPWFGLRKRVCAIMCAPCLEVSPVHLQEAIQRAASYMKYTYRDAEVKPGRSFSVTILCFLWKVHAAGLLPLF